MCTNFLTSHWLTFFFPHLPSHIQQPTILSPHSATELNTTPLLPSTFQNNSSCMPPIARYCCTQPFFFIYRKVSSYIWHYVSSNLPCFPFTWQMLTSPPLLWAKSHMEHFQIPSTSLLSTILAPGIHFFILSNMFHPFPFFSFRMLHSILVNEKPYLPKHMKKKISYPSQKSCSPQPSHHTNCIIFIHTSWIVQTAYNISHSAILQNYKTGPWLSSPPLPSTNKNTDKQSPPTKSAYNHLQNPPTIIAYKIHLQASPIIITYKIHLQSPPTKSTYNHLQNPPTIITYKIHTQNPPTIITYKIHLKSSPAKSTHNHRIQNPPTVVTYKIHIQSSPTKSVYNHRLQNPPTITTYKIHLQSSTTKSTYNQHLQNMPTIIAYKIHLKSPTKST
jgi:hypothetical protein